MEINWILTKIIISLFIWAFIWIQREMQESKKNWWKVFLWIRTNIFLSLLWVISTFISDLPYLPIFIFFSIVILMAISHIFWSFKLNKNWITAELWAFIVFWAWVFVWFWQEIISVFLIIIITLSNTFKENMHNFAGTLNYKEWLASLQLAIFSWVILPILPNNSVSNLLIWTKFELEKNSLFFVILSDINLFKIWLFVLFISWIWFIWYFLSKFIWSKWWIIISAFLWAVSSSTAVTVSLASQEWRSQKLIKSKTISYIFWAWILIWIATMMFRVIFWIFVIWWLNLWFDIFLILFLMAIIAILLAYFFIKKYYKSSEKDWKEVQIKLESPFEIVPAIKFALFYVLISVFMNISLFYQNFLKETVSFLSENMPIYIISFVSGFADVDAIYIKVSSLVWDWKMLSSVWVIAVMIAVIMNTIIKILYIKMWATKFLTKIMTYSISFISLIWIIFTFLFLR